MMTERSTYFDSTNEENLQPKVQRRTMLELAVILVVC